MYTPSDRSDHSDPDLSLETSLELTDEESEEEVSYSQKRIRGYV
jgi:hypothetical protein